MNTNLQDIVVIGGGLMGSAAAWHLSQSGKKVSLIEQQGPGYTFGSSLGKSRIARSLGPQKDIFSFFHNRSVQETEKLIDFLNRREDTRTHRMEDIYTTSPVTYIYYARQAKKVQDLLEGQQDPVTYAASAQEAKDKFGMAVPESARVFRERKPYSGTMNPEALIKKLHAAIKFSGSSIEYHHKVRQLGAKDGFYEIEITDSRTGKQEIQKCKQVVTAAGPYTGKLLRKTAPIFHQIITPKRVYLAFVHLDPEKYRSLRGEQQDKIKDSFPFIDFNDEIIFAMIDEFGKDGVPVFKVGGHLVREDISDLNKVWERPLNEKEKSFGIQSILNYLQKQGVPVRENDISCINSYSCVYSLTDSETPLVTYRLDEHNQKDTNLVVMGGMSGVGAKGAMTYGLMASNLLLQESEDSEMYRLAVNALDIDRLRDDGGNYRVKEDQTSAWFIS